MKFNLKNILSSIGTLTLVIGAMVFMFTGCNTLFAQGTCEQVATDIEQTTKDIEELEEELETGQENLEEGRLGLVELNKAYLNARSSGPVIYPVATSSTSTEPIVVEGVNSPITVGLSSDRISPLDTFTITAIFNVPTVTQYSIVVVRDNTLVTTLAAGDSVSSGTSRPVTIQKNFKLSSTIPLGDYEIRVKDYNDADVFTTIEFTIVNASGSTAQNTSNTSGTGFTSTSGSTNNTGSNATGNGTTVSGSANTSGSYTFSRDLTIGSTGEDVRQLQILLNNRGYIVSSTGPGSVGSESTYFGTKTRDALANFQRDNGITPSAGYFGPKTRAFVSAN